MKYLIGFGVAIVLTVIFFGALLLIAGYIFVRMKEEYDRISARVRRLRPKRITRKNGDRLMVFDFAVHPNRTAEFRRAVERGAEALGLDIYIFEVAEASRSVFLIAIDEKTPVELVVLFFRGLEKAGFPVPIEPGGKTG